MDRRNALRSLGAIAATTLAAKDVLAAELRGMPKDPGMAADAIPVRFRTGTFHVLTDAVQRQTLKAAFDRLIPSDANGPSASEAGCLEFLDGQLSGEYGDGAMYYLKGPLGPHNEADVMGQPQFLATPKQRYASGLEALDVYARSNDGKPFAELTPERIDAILEGLEGGTIMLGGDVNGKAFFELMLTDVRQGYLSDPIYGGNKDMAGWKMIGFPGARYDYRPYVERWNEDLGLEPLSLIPND